MATKAAPMKAPSPAESLAATLATLRTDLGGKVASLRAQIGEARERLELVSEGSIPRSEYAARLADWIDTQAREFEAGAEYAISALRVPTGPERPTLGLVPVRGGHSPELVAAADFGPLLCWLAGDGLKKRLTGIIEASGYVEGPPTKDRPRLKAEIAAELTRLELAEEKLIVEAEKVGFELPRRLDCRPEIVLSLELSEETA